MSCDSIAQIPICIKVKEILKSRYMPGNCRPVDWGLRREGVDLILTEDSRTLKLQSSAGQAPPQIGSTLVITGGDPRVGYFWTLYGL